ncbi:MAG: hypothetical protein R2848_11675 [Thermomicrobiales bacterium]
MDRTRLDPHPADRGRISLLTFAAYALLRGVHAPARLHPADGRGIRPASSYRTDVIPPNDAWVSGETINYCTAG